MNPVEAFSRLLSVDPAVGRFLLAGLGLLGAAAVFIGWRIDVDAAVNVALVIVAMAVLAVVVSRLSGVLATVLAWLAVSLVSVYAVLFLVQTVCESCLRPPVMQAGCFPNPFQRGCPLAPVAASTDLAAISPTPPEAQPPPQPGPPDAGDRAGASRIYIQFAGSLTRDQMIALGAALKADGWPVEDGQRGGERINSAFGLNEVRFFHPEDATLAAALARDIAAAAPVSGPLSTVDLSRAGYTVPRGHLEAWISRR